MQVCRLREGAQRRGADRRNGPEPPRSPLATTDTVILAENDSNGTDYCVDPSGMTANDNQQQSKTSGSRPPAFEAAPCGVERV